MPKAVLKPEKAPEVAMGKPSLPCVYLTVTKEIVQSRKVGDKVTVTLQGTVKGLSSSENDAGERASLDLEVKSVEVYGKGDNAYDKLADDEDDE